MGKSFVRWLLVVGAAGAVGFLLAASRGRSRSLPAAELRGNADTGVFHQLGCRYWDAPGSSTPLTGREEAIAGGFEPCGLCEP